MTDLNFKIDAARTEVRLCGVQFDCTIVSMFVLLSDKHYLSIAKQ